MTVAPHFAELQIQPAEFIAFLKTAFAMKRKTLLNNLKKEYGEEIIRNSLKEAGVRADVRAEALPLETTARIFRKLKN
jgi:16S rRNA A1518/A1519 N6-dimethyltransferase RsmA/KsgA/DIM1 with predicted DNA glycosylase/AP lyase activity